MITLKAWLSACTLTLVSFSGIAQTTKDKVSYKKSPVWIQMMKDTSANYFETVKAFREYFEERPMFKEANEVEGSDTFEGDVGLDDRDGGEKSEREREREARKLDPSEPNYAAEIRAFRGWFYSNKLWLRPDGSIIGPKERQSIVNKQRDELKATEKANGKN